MTDATPADPSRLLSTSELLALLEEIAGRPYMSELVDQRTHALQTAERAVIDGAAADIVVAAALHDIGRAPTVQRMYPGLPHEVAGGAFARDRLDQHIAWVIEQHVPAKRYLVAADRDYRSRLSPTSITTLAKQGSPMTDAEQRAFERHPWSDDVIALRRWDDAAKDPHSTGLDTDTLVSIFERWRRAPHRDDARH